MTAWLLAGLIAALGLPVAAQAHGPVDPAASSYEARVSQVPQGTDAEVVDGDLRMWMAASPRARVTVLDYRGAPYLRFDPTGVLVNQTSAMWYLNQVPVQTPPLGLTARTPPRWQHASSGHSYEWHDGRLHALASTARAPGATFIGRWTVPLRVGGVPTAITGGLYYAPDPSPVWFWPIVVVVACVLAALRLRRPSLDQRLARGLAAATLTAYLAAALARQLHGRPGISAGQLIVLALELAFVGWAATRVARGGGWFVVFLISAAAIWEGVTLVGTLLSGFVLLALPAFPARVVVAACLAGGVALLPVVFALAERSPAPSGQGPGRRGKRVTGAVALTSAAAAAAASLTVGIALAGCGGTSHLREPAQRIPAALAREARPIGRGARFHPPARGPVLGVCRRRLGPRDAAHVELFAADRVVLVAAGIGTRAPRRRIAGRIAAARCYGALVTLDPTGVVLVRRGSPRTIADLFASWGQPLSARRMASFRAARVTAFVDGRRRRGPVGRIRLRRHAEIVVEVGPRVPPHGTYMFPPGF